MNRLGIFFLSAALGAGGLWLYQRVYQSSTPDPAAGTVRQEIHANPANRETMPGEGGLAGAPGAAIDRSDSSEEKEIESPPMEPIQTLEELEPATAPVLVLGEDTAHPPVEKPAEEVSNPLLGAPVEEFSSAFERAREAFESGEESLGLDLYRMILAAAADRRDEIDATEVARKLLRHASDETEKLKYSLYIAESESSSGAEKYDAALGAGSALARRRDAASVRRAWRLLTVAYHSAADGREREAVLTVLEPFVKKHIFSRRYSPLLGRHSVKENDRLSTIAREYGTTVEAIQHLNGLRSDVIRLGQGLLILPGRVEVFIRKREFRLWVLVDGNFLMEKPVGLGREDSTPEGRFVIKVRQMDPVWFRPGQAPLPPEDPRNILGSRWLGFDDTDEFGGYGIHGTRDASSVGKESSSGCVRLLNADVEELYNFVPYNALVYIER